MDLFFFALDAVDFQRLEILEDNHIPVVQSTLRQFYRHVLLFLLQATMTLKIYDIFGFTATATRNFGENREFFLSI